MLRTMAAVTVGERAGRVPVRKMCSSVEEDSLKMEDEKEEKSRDAIAVGMRQSHARQSRLVGSLAGRKRASQLRL